MLAGSPFSMVLVAANDSLFFLLVYICQNIASFPLFTQIKYINILASFLKMTSKEFDKEQLVTNRDTCNMLTS